MIALDNLVKIKKLKLELADAKEFDGMLRAAHIKFVDCQIQGLSEDSKFSLAYAVAHVFSLAWLPLRKSLFGVSMLAVYFEFRMGQVACIE